MTNDFSTYDSEEKICKLNSELENYYKLLQKEKTSDFVAKKRRFSEINGGEGKT